MDIVCMVKGVLAWAGRLTLDCNSFREARIGRRTPRWAQPSGVQPASTAVLTGAYPVVYLLWPYAVQKLPALQAI